MGFGRFCSLKVPFRNEFGKFDRKQTKASIVATMAVFSKFQNLKSAYKHSEIYELFNTVSLHLFSNFPLFSFFDKMTFRSRKQHWRVFSTSKARRCSRIDRISTTWLRRKPFVMSSCIFLSTKKILFWMRNIDRM